MSIRQSRILVSMACVVLALMLVAMDCTYGGALAPPFDTEPFNTDTTGNAGSNFEGSFRRLGGPPQFRYFLGTEPLPAGPGRLILTFSLFTDGPGNDFAILTNGQSWGPLADKALFEFFLGDTLQTSFAAALAPDRLFEFELPGDDVVANRVVVTNITPDPPGVNNLAGMTFDAAGVSHPVTEPSTFLLLLIGLGSLLAMGGKLRGPSRSWVLSRARTMIAYVLARRELGYTLKEVAGYLGRDIATVATLLGRMEERMAQDEQLGESMERLS